MVVTAGCGTTDRPGHRVPVGETSTGVACLILGRVRGDGHAAPLARRSRYHSTVRRRPVSKSIVARKPNSEAARPVSSFRRGWPFG